MGNRPGASHCNECAVIELNCAEGFCYTVDGNAEECATLAEPKSPFAAAPSQESCSSCSGRGKSFFDDDALILERLEALNQGDRLLAKLSTNCVFFSQSALDVVDGLLRLTRQPQVWAGKHGRGDLLQRALHDCLQRHALPPTRALKALQWCFRAEELPGIAAAPARRCILAFFSVMLAAGAAMKFRTRPPATWKRRGVEAVEVLRGAETRLPEVVSGLRFLACVALLQQGDATVLGNRHIVNVLLRTTGVEALYKRGQDGAGAIPLAKPTAILQADASWDSFFERAQRRPQEEMAILLGDLSSAVERPSQEIGLNLIAGFPSKAIEAVPTAAFWGEEEVVFCPANLSLQEVANPVESSPEETDFNCKLTSVVPL